MVNNIVIPKKLLLPRHDTEDNNILIPEKLLSRHGTGDNYKLLVHIFFTLCCRASTSVEDPLQIHLSAYKTNPISEMLKMNGNKVLTRDYKNDNDFALRKTNPIKPNFKRKKEKDVANYFAEWYPVKKSSAKGG